MVGVEGQRREFKRGLSKPPLFIGRGIEMKRGEAFLGGWVWEEKHQLETGGGDSIFFWK